MRARAAEFGAVLDLEQVRWIICGGLVSVTAGLAIARQPTLALGVAAFGIGAVTLRRWPQGAWVVAGTVSLFFVNWARNTAAGHHGSEVIYVADLIPVFLIISLVSIADLQERLRPRLSLWLGALFLILVAGGFYRTYTSLGLTPALQVRELLPLALCVALPLSRRFREVAAHDIATILSLLAVGIAIRSFYRLGTGYSTTTQLGVERIYQTWEPFIAATIALTLLGYVLVARRVHRVHYLGLALAPVPVLFSFFRTAWVLSFGIGLLLFLIVRHGQRRAQLFVGVTLLIATLLFSSQFVRPESGKTLVSQITLRSSQIHLQLDSYRTQEYHAVWSEIRKHPIIGSGFGTEYQGDWTVYTTWSHNAYEWIWWRLGLIGLVVFLAFLTCVGWATTRALPGLEQDDRGLAVGLLAGLAFVVLAANLHENFENYQSNLFDALVIAQLMVLAIRGSHQSAPS